MSLICGNEERLAGQQKAMKGVIVGIALAAAGRGAEGAGNRAQSALQTGHKLGELRVTLRAAACGSPTRRSSELRGTARHEHD